MGAAPDRAEELFTEHSRRIYAYCLRQLGSPEEAEDAMQATYLNACRSLLSGFEPQVAQAWLFKVAQNVCLTKRRSSWRRRRVERPEDFQEIQDFIAAPQVSGDELFGIDEALAALPEQQRRAILLREWKGLSYREVATEMGLSQGAVETLIFRARRSLAAALEEPQELEEPKRRAGLMHGLQGGALLEMIRSALAGNLGVSLASGLAVAASATAVAAGPVGHLDSLRPTAQRPASTVVHTPTPRSAPADRDPSSVARDNASTGQGNAYGKGHGHGKPAWAGKGHGHGGGKPSWTGGSQAHSQGDRSGGGKRRG
ncbi:MAG TPA: RNA polymerase sigma factor [Gaiellaceae bacterium]|jgi:RNA polymerase sigma-70 factor (ECF subfamily)